MYTYFKYCLKERTQKQQTTDILLLISNSEVPSEGLEHQNLLLVSIGRLGVCHRTANFRTKILDFTGLDSSRILVLMGGIPRPIGNFPDSLIQRILVGIILVGRLGLGVP